MNLISANLSLPSLDHTDNTDEHSVLSHDSSSSFSLRTARTSPTTSTEPSSTSTFGRLRHKLANFALRREQQPRTPDEIRELIFQKRMSILEKNPTLFADFQRRARDANCQSTTSARMILYEFLQEMKLVELLEAIQDLREDRPPSKIVRSSLKSRRNMGILASFGYLRSPKKLPLSPRRPSTICRRSCSSASKVSTKTLDTMQTDDSASVLTADTIGLSMPSLDHTVDYDSDDESSVGSVSVTSWTLQPRASRSPSIRSLRDYPRTNSLRSIIDGPEDF